MRTTAADSPWWRDLRDPCLLGAIAIGLVLRAASLGHGLPQVYNPDEVSILSRALSLASGDLNPHNFLYPSLYFYVLAGLTGAMATASIALGWSPSLSGFEAHFWRDPSSVYLLGRSASVAAGVATILVVYRLAMRVGDKAVARVAALLMAVAFVPVRDAHFLKHDVPATLLIVVAVASTWWVWQRGSVRDYVTAGAAVGVACALHYPAAWVASALLAAHALRARRWFAALLGARLWLAILAIIASFAVCSPYVLMDWQTALRDIAANRAIIVERAQAAYGAFGSALPQLDILATQGIGFAWLAAAAVGVAVLARSALSTCLWLVTFPAVFFVFISNTWPFGRTANPLYPFLAILGAAGLVSISRACGRHAALALAALTVVAAAQPLAMSVTFDMLVGRTDTRTLAMQWLESNAPAGSTVAIEPYSVQLQPTREQFTAALAAAGINPDRPGHRARMLLARSPYPSPAYRLLYIGDGGMDEDKIYVPPAAFEGTAPSVTTPAQCIDFIVLKSAAPRGANPLTSAVASYARLVHREQPFADGAGAMEGFLPDFDVKPSLAVTRPGPVIEIWRVNDGCRTGAAR
jgi:hypothetical protein